MILVDTSVWVDHFRFGNSRLASLLERSEVLGHPCVIGELACGNLPGRKVTLSLLQALPAAVVAGHDEILDFIDHHRLMGIGLGYIDIQLLASARLTMTALWTRDRILAQAAVKLDIPSE
jgi:predicted nucleic acid-binding protein